MIWFAMIAAAFFAFVRQFWLLRNYKQYQGRRNLSGCEIARQLLDQMGFLQTSVQSVKGWERFHSEKEKQLLLEESIYHGRSLYALAETAKQAVLLSKSAGSMIPSDWLVRLRFILRVLILPAWILLIASQHFFPFKGGAIFILQAALILGIFQLSRDWESCQEAYEYLKKTDNFEPDELVKLRHLLSALKWNGMAEIFQVPFEIIARIFRKRENDAL